MSASQPFHSHRIASASAATQQYVHVARGGEHFRVGVIGSADFSVTVSARVPGFTDESLGTSAVVGGGQLFLKFDNLPEAIYVIDVTGNTGNITRVTTYEAR